MNTRDTIDVFLDDYRISLDVLGEGADSVKRQHKTMKILGYQHEDLLRELRGLAKKWQASADEYRGEPDPMWVYSATAIENCANELQDFINKFSTKSITNDEWAGLDLSARENLSSEVLHRFHAYKKELKRYGHQWIDDAEDILTGFIWDESEDD